MNGITVVVSSREPYENKKDFIESIEKTAGCEVKIKYVINSDGNVSLTTLYNDMSKETEHDIVVYMHDDIELLRSGWGRELLRLFKDNKDYCIIGVAGSSQFNEIGAWWVNNKKFGQVLHRSEGKSWLSVYSKLLDKDLEEVCVVDGLFFAVKKNRVLKWFDNDFKGFNHYDTSFCLANYVRGKYKIGVTTNIRIAHNSVGEMKDEWYENLNLLNKKFGKYYPIDVDNDKKRRDENGALKC